MKVASSAGPQRLPARVAAVLFAGLLAQACFDLWRNRQEVLEGPAAAAPAEPVAPPSGVDVSLIIDRHLFGPPASDAAAQAAPETRANLVLGGIWFAAGSERYALIGEAGQRQRPYRVGAQLPADAQLLEIQADRVLLRRRGQRELLRLRPQAPVSASLSAGAATSAELMRNRFR
jgi:general secretion pathway protein C